MLEKIMKKNFKKLGLILFGTILSLNSCSTYKTISPDSIKPVDQKEIKSDKEIKSYSEMDYEEAIKCIKTPKEAQNYLDRHLFEDPKDSKGESFKINHYDRRAGSCMDYSISAAALLSDNDYSPLMLGLINFNPFQKGHAMFLYKTKKGYGTLGNTPLEPKYKNIKSLIKAFNKKYNKDYSLYFISNLNETYPNKSWIDKNKKLINKVSLNQRLSSIK